MIVRDEQDYLEDCLRSVEQHVDEIVVVDTGSVDATLDIAKDFDCKILTQEWVGDFSAARNTALEAATGSWCLYIDADERLKVPAGENLPEILNDADAIALKVRFTPKTGFTPYHEIRLFRRDERIRFQGRIHETVHPSISAICTDEQRTIPSCQIGIDHVGYDGDLTHKHHRNLPLLQKAVLEHPDRVFLWANLGETLNALGREIEAEEALLRSIDEASKSTNVKQVADGALGWMQLIHLHLKNKPLLACEFAEQATQIYPQHKALDLAYAGALYQVGRQEQALPLLEHLMTLNPATYFDPLVAYDKRIFGEWALNLKGDVLLRMGNRPAAAKAYKRAALHAPDNLEYRAKAAMFDSAARSIIT